MAALMLDEETEEEFLSSLRNHGLLPERAAVTEEPEKCTYAPRQVELYPHQAKAVEEMDNGKILLGGVGTGKSRTAVAYYVAKEIGKDIVVITTAKKRDSFDWQEELHRFGVGTQRNDTLTGGIYTIDSWNNIGKYEDRENCFFIFDEQRLVGSGAWTKSFLRIAKRNRWILLSATPGDTWLDYIPVFVANGFYKNRTAFKREHVIYNNYSKFPKVDRYVGVNKLIRLRHQILVKMPYERHTRRHTHYVTVEHDKNLMKEAMVNRWHVYEKRPLRDVAELFGVMRKVVNSDSSRTEAVRTLTTKHPKLIVFYNFDYELEALRKLGRELEETQPWQTADTTHSSIHQQTPSPTDRECSASGVNDNSAMTSSTSTSGDTAAGTASTSSSSRSTERTTSSSTTETESNSYSTLSEEPSWQTTRPASTSSSRQPSTGTEGPTTSTAPAAERRSPTSSGSDGTTSTASSTEHGSTFQFAEWNGHKHEEIPSTDRWMYLVQYVAGAEGWNCTDTDTIVFHSLTYSYKNFHQAYGRIDRLNTPFTDLHYYVLKSESDIDGAILKSLKHKRNFNESSMGLEV